MSSALDRVHLKLDLEQPKMHNHPLSSTFIEEKVNRLNFKEYADTNEFWYSWPQIWNLFIVCVLDFLRNTVYRLVDTYLILQIKLLIFLGETQCSALILEFILSQKHILQLYKVMWCGVLLAAGPAASSSNKYDEDDCTVVKTKEERLDSFNWLRKRCGIAAKFGSTNKLLTDFHFTFWWLLEVQIITTPQREC